MAWTQFPRGHRLDPIVAGPPEALVVLLHDWEQPILPLLGIASRWAAAVPTTGFVALDGIEALDTGVGPSDLPRIAEHLDPLIVAQLRLAQIDGGRLVLVGFRRSASVAVQLALSRGYVGVLAFSPRLPLAVAPSLRVGAKIRLIESEENGNADHAELRHAVASLAAHGIDCRGALLDGPALSDAAIRYGGAYLVELIATAQHRHRAPAPTE
jgi:hypothetical protein